MSTAARIQSFSPFFNSAAARAASQGLTIATAMNVTRVVAAATAYDLYMTGQLPLVVLLPILLDGVLVGALAPVSALLLQGGRAARSVATGWNVMGLLSLANVAAAILSVGASFPADVAALSAPAGACAVAAVGLLALGTHISSLRALFTR